MEAFLDRRAIAGSGRRPMRILLSTLLLVAGLFETDAAQPEDYLFDDPMFRRCLTWMLTGQRGAGIDNVCLDRYEIPPPSLFKCARYVQVGFPSSTDRQVCIVIFEDKATKAANGLSGSDKTSYPSSE